MAAGDDALAAGRSPENFDSSGAPPELQGQQRLWAAVKRPPGPLPRGEHLFAHPYYWSAFIPIGDPQ